jgi:sodium-dependent dicarboxylate transporter 2/3/5
VSGPAEALSPVESKFDRRRRTISLFLGPALFAVVLSSPGGDLSPEAHRLSAVLAWVLVYWVGEAIPIPATALLGPVSCVLLGIGADAVFAPFAHPVVFLFLGSFLLAQNDRPSTEQRIALSILS